MTSTVAVMKTSAVVGGALLVASLIVAPDRAWPNVLIGSMCLTGLGLAGTFFVALQYVSGASWSIAFRRVPEAMVGVLPAGLVGMGVLFVIHPSLYPWVSDTALAGFKGAWLSLPFFLVRAVVYATIWLVLSLAIVRASRRQDEDGSLKHSRRLVKLSALFVVTFALTFWLASVDWVMSLDPTWYSTMFGLYGFAGLFSSGLAAIILLAVWLERTGPLRGIFTVEHQHDLGKLLFAFSTFWMYIWFSQYMLIWYDNIPEEAQYFAPRFQTTWLPLSILNLVLNWAVPFVVLLSSGTKRNAGILVKVAVVVLLGRWVDLYLMIVPSTGSTGPVFGIWELGTLVGVVGLFVVVFVRTFKQASPVPKRDPFLSESLHYHS